MHCRQDAVNPEKHGTKVAAHYQVTIGAGQTQVIRLRLASSFLDQKGQPFGKPFDELFADRLREADDFAASLWTSTAGDRRLVVVNYAANQSQYSRSPAAAGSWSSRAAL